ncbi:kinase-like protein [Macrolepiota fuliginosa MF-IS2]|uniref:Kinase-like protein n=1 Tax=Macrolepiota fuliginosa MF-IS2 TaxID=1400762 RepID=A0A9P5WZP8_9AGAR|nr:kinase-like protein [Macrolepiota fuliginosa MF-IS2]
MIRKIAIDHQLPAHPGDHIATEPLDTVDSLMWNLMLDCWSLNPEERPNCQRILDKLNKLGESAGQGNDGSSSYATREIQNIRNTMRTRTKDIVIDLDEIRRILIEINASDSAPEQSPPASSEPDRERSVRMLKSILQAAHKKMALEELMGDDAQLMTDFLSLVLQSHDLPTWFQTHAAVALYRLIRFSGLYPQLHTPRELKDVTIHLENVYTSGHTDIFRSFYRNHLLCVKVVRTSLRDLDHINKIMVKELVILTILRHPNILPFYGAYSLPAFPNRLSLVFPWMENGNLVTFLQNHPFMRREPFIYDIISGLEYLHEKHVVHGMLKGSDVLVNNIGRACITGFELSWFLDLEIGTTTTVTQSAPGLGAVRWVAPEILTSEVVPHTKASDIWAFGCVCFEVISGKLPYHQYSSNPQIILRLMRGISPAQLSEDLAPGLNKAGDGMRDLIARCWDFDPGNRPTAQTIARALEEQGFGGRTVRDDGTSNFQNVIWGDLESEVDWAAVEKLLNTLDALPDPT